MRSPTSSRRRVLLATASATSLLSITGCTSDEPNDDDAGANRTGTDTAEQTETEASTTGTEETSTTEPSSSPTETDESFEAPHGATIEATRYGDGDCGVVLVPQINEDRESWQPQARALAELGHLALAIDEDPDDRASSVVGAIQYLRAEHEVSTVGLVGASSGGEAVVIANAETDESVAGTMTLSAAGGVDRASELQGRSVFVVATGDDEKFVQTARELHENAPEPTELVEYDGSAHGQGLFESDHGEDLRDRFETFLTEVCRE